MLDRTIPLLAIMVALLACKQTKQESKEQAAPVAEPAKAAEPADPCAGKPLRRTIDTRVCAETGSKDGTTDLVDSNGAKLADLANGTLVKRLREEPGSEDIRRGPGHVDTAVCIAEGPKAGAVGYVKNTHLFGRCL